MFKTMTSVLDTKKTPSEDEISKISPYIFCRWLSGNIHTILAANQFNLYYNIPIKNQYDVIKSAFAGKIKFIPYPSTTNETSDTIKKLAIHFKISEEKAYEYLNLISQQELNLIIKSE